MPRCTRPGRLPAALSNTLPTALTAAALLGACAGTSRAPPTALPRPTTLSAEAAAAACQVVVVPVLAKVRLTGATLVAAGSQRARLPNGLEVGEPLPAHCVLQGRIDERTCADGLLQHTGFELRLPSASALAQVMAGPRNGRGALYTGWPRDSGLADPIFSPLELADDQRRLNDAHGAAAAALFARSFFVPGMTHCGGGPATDAFDGLGAQVRWVEQRQAPERITARGAGTLPATLSRPLCPWPQVARYAGGDASSEASFTCR